MTHAFDLELEGEIIDRLMKRQGIENHDGNDKDEEHPVAHHGGKHEEIDQRGEQAKDADGGPYQGPQEV